MHTAFKIKKAWYVFCQENDIQIYTLQQSRANLYQAVSCIDLNRYRYQDKERETKKESHLARLLSHLLGDK